MRKLLFLFTLFIILSSFSKTELIHPVSAKEPAKKEIFPIKDKEFEKKISSLKIKVIEKDAGKKFTLKEKISIKLFQLQLKKELNRNTNDEPSKKGKTSKILGIIGLVLLFVPYATLAALPLSIIAIVMGTNAAKENPKDKNARTGKILGWITLGLFTLFLIVAIIILASGFFLF